MGKHLILGFCATVIFAYVSAIFLPSLVGDFYLSGCILAALLFGTMATCTSMILKKLDVLITLNAAQSAKLRSIKPTEEPARKG